MENEIKQEQTKKDKIKENNIKNKEKRNKTIGIYIHIPFCTSKCFYCDFVSFAKKGNDFIDKYIKALLNQIENELFNFKKEDFKEIYVDTVYIGGGTPSYIFPKHIKSILDLLRQRFNILDDAEITIEANPESLTEYKIEKYKDAKINRISIGLQTTNDTLLKKIGRPHTYKEFEKIYKIAKSKFRTNVDLIFALPDQTMEDLKKDIQKILSLNPDSISLYSLILEENTKLYNMYKKNMLNLPDENLERKMQKLIYKSLEKNGYYRYEISNFSKPNKYSRHNTNTWLQHEYLGFGINSSSYFKNIRFSTTSNIKDYINYYSNNFKIKTNKNENKEKQKDKIILIEEIQNKYDQMKEHIYLGLRMNKYYTKNFYLKFNEKCEDVFKKELYEIQKQGLIDITKDPENKEFNIISLNEKGLDFANRVLIYFI